MLRLLKLRMNLGNQTIPNVRKAVVDERFRGFPILKPEDCSPGCSICEEICPTTAISLNPLELDLGRCIFCGDCEQECPNEAIRFTNHYKTASTSREYLAINRSYNIEDYQALAIETKKEINKIFGKSLKLRSVSAGGCNSCEMELNACSNVNFDIARFGIEFVASPRHSDGLVITGPVTENMAKPIEDAYIAVPNPKIVIAVGACAISGGIFANSGAVNREFFEKHPVDLYIPGCPIHPLTFINGILDFLDRTCP